MTGTHSGILAADHFWKLWRAADDFRTSHSRGQNVWPPLVPW
jgi:hypothetical protein